MITLKSNHSAASKLGRLASSSRTFVNLDTLVDDVHRLFDAWEASEDFSHTAAPSSFGWARLAVHEWIANLVQHADFRDAKPNVLLTCWPKENRLVVMIEDNSCGFDFHHEYAVRRSATHGPAPPERGMGLLMLAACTQNVKYTRSPERRNQLQFSVSASQNPCLNIRF